jgi:hypothetical protein
MHLRTSLKRAFVLATASAIAVTTVAALPAQAAPSATTGLYGSADPTYDGVTRQSLAIMGQLSNGITPPKAAITWLVHQQCTDGSFQAYRSDLTKPCSASDPVNYSGPDTNQTAVAAAALALAGKTENARRAVVWLNGVQSGDGGWPYYPGGDSDANSTSLAILALRNVQPQDRSARVPNAVAYLAGIQIPCGQAGGGALPYQAGGVPSQLASSEAMAGIVGRFPVAQAVPLTRNPRCTGSVEKKLASYLATAITMNGVLTSDFGTGADYGSTARSIIGLNALEVGKAAVARGSRALQSNARAYVLPKGVADPGALGLLMLVADATGVNPKSYGGVNLVRTLSASIR